MGFLEFVVDQHKGTLEMSRFVALYGFVRQIDGLRSELIGIRGEKCALFHAGSVAAAVVSPLRASGYRPSPNDMLHHDQVVQSVHDVQTILPAKFPKILTMEELEKSMAAMAKDLPTVMRQIENKSEYHVRIFLVDAKSPCYYNTVSKFIMQHASKYEYKHYFPILGRQAKEAEFMDYTEDVVKRISQKLCAFTTYWRGKSFNSENSLLKSYFWVKKRNCPLFENNVKELRGFFPNLRICVSGPNPLYNFVSLDFCRKV